MTCSFCGDVIRGRPYGSRCQACYRYLKTGGEMNDLPPDGVIVKDYRGYVVCHICGRAYKRLGSHVKESHSMTIDNYKEKFGLCRRCKTTSEAYSAEMKTHALLNHMPERLMTSGLNTRIKPGQTDMRKGKPIRLQERINKSLRSKKI